MFTVYKVKQGDTLASIAKSYNSTPEYIASINNFDPLYSPQSGTDIIVPSKSDNLFTHYEVKKGDTINKIAAEFNTRPEELLEVNGLDKNDYIYPGEIIIIPKKGVESYTTVEGDTLSSVAKKFGITQLDLINKNESLYLYPGQPIVYNQVK